MNSPNRSGSLPLGLAGRLNPVCDRFESQWLAGSRPRLEEFLPLAVEADRAALLRELLELELHYRSRRGENITEQEYRQRLPKYSDLVALVFSCRATLSEGEATGSFRDIIDQSCAYRKPHNSPFTWQFHGAESSAPRVNRPGLSPSPFTKDLVSSRHCGFPQTLA